MVRCYVQKYSYVRSETISIIQLETAYFHHIPLHRMLSDLPGKTVSYIPYHRHIITCLLKYMIGQLGSRALTITPGNRNDLAIPFIHESKLYLTAYLYLRLTYLFHHIHLIADTRALYHAVCLQYLLHSVATLFKTNGSP